MSFVRCSWNSEDISDSPEWQLRDELTAIEGLKSNWEMGGAAKFSRVILSESVFQAQRRACPESAAEGTSRGLNPNRDGATFPHCSIHYNPTVFGILAATAATAALTAAGYQSMAPTGQWYGRTFIGLPRGTKQLALTYDDGPNDPYTLRLLEVLAKHEVKATFFLIGRYVQQRPDLVIEIAKAGHVIGNHTFSHPVLTFKSTSEVRGELLHCQSILHDVIGKHSNLFRPPFGGRRPAVLSIARELGLEPVMWNVTGFDWTAPPSAMIEKKVSRQIRGGDVILLHDGGHKQMGADRSQTVQATDHLITKYKSETYEFKTIPEMIKENKIIRDARGG
jgi:peptidoglycan/xylan/chitin deacetylase (PgdA/CDA1 family)